MKVESLVTMANQIGAFFETMPDLDQARQDTANHLRRSWDPRMRQLLLEHIDCKGVGGSGLTAFVYEALVMHRDSLTPKGSAETLSG